MAYSKKRFKNLVNKMVKVYGVTSYLNNITEDMTPEEIDNDLWFACPECGEPILYEDWDLADFIDGNEFTCPICEEILEF